VITRSLIALTCALILSACAASGPLYEPAPLPAAAGALIYIYRPSGFALGGRDAYFYIDDVNVVDISNNGYSWLHLPAGEYTLKQKWPFDVTYGLQTLELKVRWLPERTYFYRLETSIRGPSVEWRLREVSSETAITEIQRCKLQPAFGIDKLLQQVSGRR
jgi:Protein of unknown function (DUF2846)